VQGLWDELWHLDAHHSTAIEGNTLILREVRAVLDQGRAIGGKELSEYMEVLGYGEAAKWVYDQGLTGHGWEGDQLVTLTELREIHHMTMGPVWDVAPHPSALPSETPGSFREHDIREFSGGMRPPAFPLVPPMIGAWVDGANDLGRAVRDGSLPPVDVPERLAELHCEFEHIHPFLDGNGRTGRLTLNLLLVRLGWPPVVILRSQRERYLSGLDKADRGDPGPLGELLARAVIDSIHRLLPQISGRGDLLPLSALADAGLSVAALKQAAIRGRLEAVRDNSGRWLASRSAVEEYKASRHRRR
jgi:fido (protein-threonine AMPylation protein)